jgi:hypothetical protein
MQNTLKLVNRSQMAYSNASRRLNYSTKVLVPWNTQLAPCSTWQFTPFPITVTISISRNSRRSSLKRMVCPKVLSCGIDRHILLISSPVVVTPQDTTFINGRLFALHWKCILFLSSMYNNSFALRSISVCLPRAQVLDNDVFAAFEETGNVFDAETAEKARKYIYSAGNTVAPQKLFRALRGRDPEISFFLKNRGLV